jgi:hypothetical protein
LEIGRAWGYDGKGNKCSYSNRSGHNPKDIHAPSDNNNAVVEVLFQCLSQQDQPRDHEKARDVIHRKASFWLKVSIVSSDVAIREIVVEEVAKAFA